MDLFYLFIYFHLFCHEIPIFLGRLPWNFATICSWVCTFVVMSPPKFSWNKLNNGFSLVNLCPEFYFVSCVSYSVQNGICMMCISLCTFPFLFCIVGFNPLVFQCMFSCYVTSLCLMVMINKQLICLLINKCNRTNFPSTFQYQMVLKVTLLVISHSIAPINLRLSIIVTWRVRMFVRLCYLGQTYF